MISDPNLPVTKVWITNAPPLPICKFSCLNIMMIHLYLLVANQVI